MQSIVLYKQLFLESPIISTTKKKLLKESKWNSINYKVFKYN